MTATSIGVEDSAWFFDFKTACDFHDRCYGTWDASKSACDRAFLSNMRSDCRDRSWFAKGLCLARARAHYFAIWRAPGISGTAKGRYRRGQNAACPFRGPRRKQRCDRVIDVNIKR
jgi:hypothetical protein